MTKMTYDFCEETGAGVVRIGGIVVATVKSVGGGKVAFEGISGATIVVPAVAAMNLCHLTAKAAEHSTRGLPSDVE